MTIITGNTIDEVYGKVVKKLLKKPMIQNETKEIENAILFVKHPSLTNISFPYRHISMKYAEHELVWYWSGDNSCEDIGKYAKMWLVISDDGKTSNSAYGYILFKKYKKNQLEEVIECLKQDSTNRKAVLNISDPAIDRLHTKDMQCTIALQFLIRNNQLDMSVYMRSNDIYFGLPYDYIFFESIQQYVAKRLNLPVGTYLHSATSMHMYVRDYGKFLVDTEKQIITIDYQKTIDEFYDKGETKK